MIRPLPYPPPWMDAATLAAHICIGERTIDVWVKEGRLPPARMIGGKRMWKWTEVDACLAGEAGIVPEQDLAQKVFHATKKASNANR